jgi:hypothetical protein
VFLLIRFNREFFGINGRLPIIGPDVLSSANFAVLTLRSLRLKAVCFDRGNQQTLTAKVAKEESAKVAK